MKKILIALLVVTMASSVMIAGCSNKSEDKNTSSHAGHFPQGLPSTGCSQFTAFAKIFATVVFPVPRVPQNK